MMYSMWTLHYREISLAETLRSSLHMILGWYQDTAGPSDCCDPDLHPRGLWLQGAAVPAGDAGQIHAAKAGSPPHKINFCGKTLFILRGIWYTDICRSAEYAG